MHLDPVCTSTVSACWPSARTVKALIQRVAQEVESESGVELEQLINPGKVRCPRRRVRYPVHYSQQGEAPTSWFTLYPQQVCLQGGYYSIPLYYVRKSKDRLGVDVNTKMFLLFADRVIVLSECALFKHPFWS